MCGYEDMCWGEVKRDVGEGYGGVGGSVENVGKDVGKCVGVWGR